ncbi:hypothetical protein B0H13DRAFT_1519685, partial [Mycena leptocephala]
FTAGIRTNGRVEVENRITKHISGPGKNLFQVFTALNEQTKDQHKAELLKPILDMLRDHGGIYAVQTSFKQMQLAMFYNASALQLPTGVRDWSRNDFTKDNAYIGTRFLLRLVGDHGLIPAHVLKITHAQTGATHIL